MESIEMTTMLGPPHPVAMPTVTKTDKLRLAAAKGELEVVRDLLDSGTPLQPDKEGRTPLHFAAQNGHLNVVTVCSNMAATLMTRTM
uniref:Phytochrome-interacting ankyrin-repeat protein 1-like isoform X2 n=1 Tax=Crassostrea virginica TaxID=6565 RepID=A0A8B8AN75_CRAVI|nr:phytochrome-interacting ankyrin-repeat protein 1-like isoform X2 [Crassostrea virginica]